jgi:voltage-gated potassium channel
MIKQKAYHLVEKGSHGSRINILFDYFIMGLIILNVTAIILESVSTIKATTGNLFRDFEVVSVIIFSVEYLIRIYVSDLTHPSKSRLKSVLRFVFSAYGLIDLLAILPFYLPFLIKIDLRFLRLLRLMRFLRVLKLNRYNKSLKLIWEVMKEKRTEMAVTGFVTLLILLIASFLMYYIEGNAQPDKFSNILDCFWWAVATLTTVGYGDVYPITGFGKFISGLIAILGIGLVALPTGILSSGFIEKIGNKKNEVKKCPHCGEIIE